VAGATPLPKNGVAGPPPFWGWPKPPPGLWGWSGHLESHQEKKNEMGLCRWGWPNHPQGPGVASATPYDHTQALGGGPATPNGTNPFRFFFSWWLSGWPDHPQRPKPPHTGRMGWPKPPLGQKGGGPATPFLGKGGGSSHPRFPLFFFKFLLKKKKKKLKSEMGQNYAVLGFGRAQNGVVLE
jgi:hypothetical protein